MTQPMDPKALLDALMKGETAGLPADVAARARKLAGAVVDAKPADVEALPEAAALAVLEAAVRQRAPALAAALAESSKKPLAKAGKRALYQLRSLGVDLPKPAAAPSPAAPAPAAPEALPGLMTPLTGNGERGLILARPIRGGVEVVQLVYTDELGVVHLAAKELTRGQYRSFFKPTKPGAPPPALELPAAEVRALLADAAARNLRAKHPFPAGTEEALRHFGTTPQLRAVDIPAPTAADERSAADAVHLHEEPEIRAWLPPVDALRALALKTDEIATSQLYINDAQRREQVTHQTRAAAEGFFTPEVKRLYAERLWAMGDFYAGTGRATPAELARAEARRLAAGAAGLTPFSLKLFEKVIELSMRMRAGEELPPPGEPGEKPQAPQAPAERRSPGGLILP